MALSIEWFGTASFRIRADGVTFLLDPWVSRNPYAKPPHTVSFEDLVAGASTVFLSHGHFDHAADLPELLELNPDLQIYGPASAISRLKERVPAAGQRLNEVPGGVPRMGGTISVDVRTSEHVRFDLPLMRRTLTRAVSSPARSYLRYGLFRDHPSGETVTYFFTFGGRYRMHFLGSAGPDERMLDQWASDYGSVDCLLLPLQGHSRISDIGARIVATLKPKLVVPHHHDDFYPPLSDSVDISEFRRLVREGSPDTRVRELEIGEVYDLPA